MILGGDNPATASRRSSSTYRWAARRGAPLPPDVGAAHRTERRDPTVRQGAALGGSAQDNVPSTASLGADLFDPETETWTPAGVVRSPRSTTPSRCSCQTRPSGRRARIRAEACGSPTWRSIAPAYLFTTDAGGNVIRAPRPTIASVAATVGYGAPFQVATPDAADIASVTLIRPGAADARIRHGATDGSVSTFTRGSGMLSRCHAPESERGAARLLHAVPVQHARCSVRGAASFSSRRFRRTKRRKAAS